MVLWSDLVGGDRERDLESLSLAATSGRCCLNSTVDGTAATRPEGRSTGFDSASSPDDDDDDDDDEELEWSRLVFVFLSSS